MVNRFLTGKKIYLTLLSENDITERYINWLNDKEVCRDNSHATFPNTRAKTLAYVKSLENSKDEIAFAIRWKRNDEHIGNIAIKNIDRINSSAELAIIIGERKYWNKGVGTEAYELMIDYGLNTLNLNRISSGQTVKNFGMISVCKKMGLKREGVLREVLYKDGEYLDAVIYSILKKDFKRNK